ncbi:uncharacterized protein B0J16DRAFT_197746 [Fusarium flagelliforme]|uniref:uncharacterized protein n=1 Tax=Fusarium flagelliforme TaxID=2675880 RepID=UPI001E8D9A9E|nr:uncharacterized protein B0J16DRAFT_197746 [Fusarium flagelliforme]KAH7173809.1 hypothetical protein B0J16DRAFT_197746 [Fusarium flagelliforme]
MIFVPLRCLKRIIYVASPSIFNSPLYTSKMQRIICAFLLFHFYICRSNALYAKIPTPTETSAPNRTNGHLAERGVPSEMITCGYKNGDPEAVTTPPAGSVCRFSTHNGLWGLCKSGGDPRCTLVGRCRDHHECFGGCGKTENTKFLATTCKKEQYCSFAYLIMDEGHTYTQMGCGAVFVTDTFFMTPQVPQLTKPGTTQTTMTAETLNSTSDTTDETAPSETAETANEASGPHPSSNVGAIVAGVVGGLAVICGTAIAALYLLRKNRDDRPETEKGTTTKPKTPGDGPKGLERSNPPGLLDSREVSELQGSASPVPPRLPPVELP